MPYINSDGFFEQEYNFREFEKLFASKSKRVLSAADLTPDELVQQLSILGSYAEIAHSSVDVPFVLQNLDTLSASGFPLEGYDALRDLHHVRSVHSTIGEHQGYCATIPRTKTALLAFSGTAHVAVAFRLVWMWKTRFVQKSVPSKVRLHYGFQKVYAAALRTHARKALKDAFEELGEVDTLILTGHSLGGTLSQFMLLEILEDILSTPPACAESTGASDEEECPWRQNPPNIICTTFGSPRPGNKSFKKYYAQRVADYREKTGKDLKHWSIVGHRDGVPATPPGFAPVTSVGETFYLYHGDLYNVPVEEAKHSIFKVVRDESRPARFEHGGHNYYSARDMERLLHRLRHIREDRDAGLPVEEWTKRYLQREEDFKLAQAKKAMRTWRKSKSADLTHEVSPSTSSSPSHSPTSSEIDKHIEKKDETTDGQTAVEPSRVDWSKMSLEDDILLETDDQTKGAPTVPVDESDSTTRPTTNAQTNVPVFATTVGVDESAKDLAAAVPQSR